MKLNFCPTCAAPLTASTTTHYRCPAGHEYFNNPRATVLLLLINDQSELLFARRAHEPQKDKYDFPGGFVDYGETGLQAVQRELAEETGAQALQLTLIGSVANEYEELVSTVDCVYACTAWQGELTPQDDVAALEWQPLDFMNSAQFAWPGVYRDQLYTLITQYLSSQNTEPTTEKLLQ